MRPSFQRRLLLHLALPILLLGLLAAAAQFLLAWRELRQSQDDMLRQTAALILAHPRSGAGPMAPVRLRDRDSRMQFAVLPIDPAPPWLRPLPAQGLHTVDGPDGRMRVQLQRAGPYTVIVAQPTDTRDELAWAGALQALLPSLLLVLVLVGVLSRVVRAEFAPIARAAQRLAAQRELRQPRLGIEPMPREIQPFVDEIEALLQRTHELMRQQQRFVADAAHELRSPLTALALQARNLRHAVSWEQALERLAPLEQGIERARRLSEQLLGLAGLGSVADERVGIDIVELARDLLAKFHPLAEQRGIDLGLEAPQALDATIMPRLLRTILSNALDNAIKYTPAGGDVTLVLRTVDDVVRCEVVDSGAGIPAALRVDVFKPFHRLHDNDVEGSGLGLAIAQEAAARMGASLSLHDREHRQGLVLRIDFEAAAAKPGP